MAAHVVLLDIGNTHTRMLVAGGEPPNDVRVFPTNSLTVQDIPAGLPAVACCVVPEAEARLAGSGVHFLRPSGVPLSLLDLRAVDASTLGADRLANAIEATAHGGAAAVFDFGTAITLEVVERGIFRGGAIFPGRRLQRTALHKGTALLPEPPLKEIASTHPGTDTASSIAWGVDRGAVGAVRELTDCLQREFGEDICLLATGGDAPFFLREIQELKDGGWGFTLRGLLRWYLYEK